MFYSCAVRILLCIYTSNCENYFFSNIQACVQTEAGTPRQVGCLSQTHCCWVMIWKKANGIWGSYFKKEAFLLNQALRGKPALCCLPRIILVCNYWISVSTGCSSEWNTRWNTGACLGWFALGSERGPVAWWLSYCCSHCPCHCSGNQCVVLCPWNEISVCGKRGRLWEVRHHCTCLMFSHLLYRSIKCVPVSLVGIAGLCLCCVCSVVQVTAVSTHVNNSRGAKASYLQSVECLLFILLAVLRDLSCVLESVCSCWIKTSLAAVCEAHVSEKQWRGCGQHTAPLHWGVPSTYSSYEHKPSVPAWWAILCSPASFGSRLLGQVLKAQLSSTCSVQLVVFYLFCRFWPCVFFQLLHHSTFHPQFHVIQDIPCLCTCSLRALL